MTNDERNVVEQALGLLEEVYENLPEENDDAAAMEEAMNLLDSLFEGEGEDN